MMQGSGYYQRDKTRWRTLYWTVREIIQRKLAIIPWHSFAASNSEGTNYFFSRSFSVLFNFSSASLRKHPFLLRSTPLGRSQRRRAKEKRMLSQAIPPRTNICIQYSSTSVTSVLTVRDWLRKWHHNSDDSTDIIFKIILLVLYFSLISSCVIHHRRTGKTLN